MFNSCDRVRLERKSKPQKTRKGAGDKTYAAQVPHQNSQSQYRISTERHRLVGDDQLNHHQYLNHYQHPVLPAHFQTQRFLPPIQRQIC